MTKNCKAMTAFTKNMNCVDFNETKILMMMNRFAIKLHACLYGKLYGCIIVK